VSNIVPFDQLDGFIWLDGEIVKWQEATIHILSHGLNYASVVFEGIRVYNTQPFKCIPHITRLHHSAGIMGFALPYDQEILHQATCDVIKLNGINNGYVRPLAWRGTEKMLISGHGCKVHTAIAAWPTFEDDRLVQRLHGTRLNVSKWRKGPLSVMPHSTKASSIYAISTLVKNEALAQGFDDALMLDLDDRITECSTANFFAVINGVLTTPKPGNFLDGITRQTVISLAKEMGIEVVERDMFVEDLSSAEAAFLTGTAIEILPVSQISLPGVKMQVASLDIKHPHLQQLSKAYSAICQQKT